MRLVSWRDYNIPREMVEDAWGYNAVSKMVGDTPSKVELYNNQRIVKLPLMLRRYVTAFEYDNGGLLIGWYNHVGGSHYKVEREFLEVIDVDPSTLVPTLARVEESVKDSGLVDKVDLVLGVRHYRDWETKSPTLGKIGRAHV